MTHDEAWAALADPAALAGATDGTNPSRVYVHRRLPGGRKGPTALYLIWEPGDRSLRKITVFPEYRDALAPNFGRLLSPEISNSQAAFVAGFQGPLGRSRKTLDLPDIAVEHLAFEYDRIGVHLVYRFNQGKVDVVLSVVDPKQ